MRVAASIEATDSGIEYMVVVHDDELPADLDVWFSAAVRHCHDLRERSITADNDRAVVERMETE